jgi:hypothetical protein
MLKLELYGYLHLVPLPQRMELPSPQRHSYVLREHRVTGDNVDPFYVPVTNDCKSRNSLPL